MAKAMAMDLGAFELKYGAADSNVETVSRVRSVVGADAGRIPYIGARLDIARRRGILQEEEEPTSFWENVEICEKLWAYAYEQVGWKSHEHPLVVAVRPNAAYDALELLTQVFFERFNVPSLKFLSTPLSALYGNGKLQGIVIDVGEDSTTVSPVHQGVVQRYALQQEPIGGRALTSYFERLLLTRLGYTSKEAFQERIPLSAVNNVRPVPSQALHLKEAVCRCAMSYAQSVGKQDAQGAALALASAFEEKEKEVAATLPDGSQVSMVVPTEEQYQAGELLFRPTYPPHDKELLGVQQVFWNSVQSMPLSVSKELSSSVLACGGTTLVPGFSDRLSSELTCITPDHLKPRVTFPRDRSDIVWKGTALVSTFSQFDECYVSKEEYNESGPSIIHRV